MRTKIIKILLIVIFLFVNNLVFSQKQSVFIKHYTIDDGLSQTSVNCVIQDSRGFIWIGTQSGLSKYDGYKFTNFKYQPNDTNSISNNYIYSMCEDNDGNLWIGTKGGLNKYDFKENKFYRFFTDIDDIEIDDNRIFSVLLDSKGDIWFKTISHLSRLNTKDYLVRHYRHYNNIFSFISDITTFSIIEDNNGNLWLGTEDGLNFFDRNLEIFKRYYYDKNNPNSINSNHIRKIFFDSKKNLWIGTDKGLNLFNPQTQGFKHIPFKNNKSKQIESQRINDIYEDISGLLWLGTDGGLKVLNRDYNFYDDYKELKYELNVLVTSSIRAITQDENGIFWIGTLKGLVRINRNTKRINLYSKTTSGVSLFTNNHISAIYLENEFLWVGTRGSGLHKYNRETGKIIKYNSKNSIINNDFICNIFRDSKNRLWIATQNGVYYFDSGRRKINYFPKYEFENNRIYEIYEDSKNSLWFCTSYGLYKYSNNNLESFFHDISNKKTISSNVIYNILEDKDVFWIGTDKGLNKFNKSTGEFFCYKKEQGKFNCISCNDVVYLHQDIDDNNILWLGTLFGLNKYEKKADKFLSYTKADGLPDNVVYSIIENGNNNLWLSTNRGISQFNKDRQEFHNFGISDGLQDYEFNIGASYKSQNGEIFFGGISGINSFYPDSIIISSIPPKIAITQVDGVVKSKKITYPSTIKLLHLPYKNNLVTIEFAVLDYTNSKQNKYAYKLEGVDNEWINIGSRRYATFSKLAPGKYTFRVKGANSDYVWNEEGVAFDIVVKTPIWKKKISYVLYIILLILLIFFLIHYRTRHLIKTNIKLKEKELIAKQVAKQKEELSIKNKNITDSIIYAKRIQESLLPSKLYFKELLPKSFILFKPKDIVSGDFYWITQKKDKIFVVVADCTGHGVPGAFMSIIGFELLRNIIEDQNIQDASEIIYYLNKGIIDTIGKGDDAGIKDGMDLALCVIDKDKSILEYSGAFRPLYIVRENKIKEIKGGRFSIGMLGIDEKDKIEKVVIDIEKDDVFYMFSDGYADQFGGPDGKKYKYRRFRHLLLNIHQYNMEEQKSFLDKSIEDWKGDEDQVDDIMIVGIKPF